MQKNILITLLLSLAAGAAGGYFSVTYLPAGQEFIGVYGEPFGQNLLNKRLK